VTKVLKDCQDNKEQQEILANQDLREQVVHLALLVNILVSFYTCSVFVIKHHYIISSIQESVAFK
jgi:hypothetical protein